MARAKTNTRKSKNVLEQDRYTAELSTGQLVIGVCILLMFGLACFLLGVLIGKVDPTLHPDVAIESQPVVESPVKSSTNAPADAVARTQEPLGGPVTTPPPPEMRVPPNISSRNIPAKSKPEPAKSAKPVTTKSVTEAVKETAETPGSEGTDAKPGTPTDPEDKPETTVVAQSQDQEAVAPPSAQPESTPIVRARFSVQIAAFNTRQRAEVVKNELEAKSDYKAELVVSSSGRWVRVMVGSFAERVSADKVHADLQEKYQYKDSWVVSR